MSSPYTTSLSYLRSLLTSTFDSAASSSSAAVPSSSFTLPELSFFFSLLPPLSWLLGSSDHHQKQTFVDYGLGLGYESGRGAGLVPWVCFGFRVLAASCVLPFAFLILLDLIGYVIARTLHIAPRRVRVRAASSSSSTSPPPTTTIPTGSSRAIIASSIGLTTSNNDTTKGPIFSSTTLTTAEPESYSQSTSISPIVGLQPLSSSGASSASSSSSNLTELGKGGSGSGSEDGGGGGGGLGLSGAPAFTSKRYPKVRNLHISPISRPLPPIARSVSTPPSSTIASYSTTPGERHTDLPLEPPFSPPSSSSTVSLKRRSSTRARAASIGVEGPLGLQSDDDDDDDDDDEGDGDRTLLAGKVDSDESGTDGLRLRRVPTVTAGSAY